MKSEITYIAEDGRQFKNKEDCELHEKVVCPAAGIIQSALKTRVVNSSPDNFPKVFAEIMTEHSDQFRNLLAKVGGIRARKQKNQSRS